MRIDYSKCINCKQCQRVCPAKIINATDKSTSFVEGKLDNCIKCYHCMAICPREAIFIDGVTYDCMAPIDEGKSFISKENMKEYFMSRRSIRTYTDEEISDEIFADLLDTIQWQSSAHNQHTIKWKIIKGKDRVQGIADQIINILEPKKVYEDYVNEYKRGKNSLTRGASHIVIGYIEKTSLVPNIDSAVAAAMLELFAPAYDLGACWAGYIMLLSESEAKVKEIFNIPDKSILTVALLMGYPDNEKYLYKPSRAKATIEYM